MSMTSKERIRATFEHKTGRSGLMAMRTSLKPLSIKKGVVGLTGYELALSPFRTPVKDISQEKLAELADVHRNYVGKIERGEQNITLTNLCRFAEVFDSRLSELLADAGY